MIAHALGLGLYEKEKLWWLSDEGWTLCGYIVNKNNNIYSLTRYPLHRFDDDDNEKCFSIIRTSNLPDTLTKTIIEIKKDFPDLTPEDLCIIFLDDESYIYDYIPKVQRLLYQSCKWETNIAIETKKKEKGRVFVTNRNNAKGLEFPIVICISSKLKRSISYRNTLYTMLTRSFIRSYLIVSEKDNGITEDMLRGISNTLKNKDITVKAPSEDDKVKMHRWMVNAKRVESLKDKIDRAFKELGIFDLARQEDISELINVEKFKDAEYDKILKLIDTLKDMA